MSEKFIDIDKIIQIESSGNPNAVSDKGAVGLMQITQPVLDDYNNKYDSDFTANDMIIPEHNKVIGFWYINTRIPEMFKAYDIFDCSVFRLIAYNWGIGNLKKWYETLPEETRHYLKKYFNCI